MTGIKVSFMHPQKEDVNCLFMEDNLNLLWFIIDQSSLLDRMYINCTKLVKNSMINFKSYKNIFFFSYSIKNIIKTKNYIIQISYE